MERHRCGYCGRFIDSDRLIVWGVTNTPKPTCHRLACDRAAKATTAPEDPR